MRGLEAPISKHDCCSMVDLVLMTTDGIKRQKDNNVSQPATASHPLAPPHKTHITSTISYHLAACSHYRIIMLGKINTQGLNILVREADWLREN